MGELKLGERCPMTDCLLFNLKTLLTIILVFKGNDIDEAIDDTG